MSQEILPDVLTIVDELKELKAPQSSMGPSIGHRPNGPIQSISEVQDGFVKAPETVFGEPHPTRRKVKNAHRIVVKVGTAVVTRTKDQRLALGRLGALVEQLEALLRSGRQIILVTSGSVSVGRQKLKQQRVLNSTPLEMHLQGSMPVSSRAAAAAGQSGLMALYDNLFGLMDLQAAQVLVTSNDFHEPTFRENLAATAEDLLSMSVVPVFNENDAISARDKAGARESFKDNDSLASLLAVELKADLLVLLTDVSGLYTGPPTKPESKIIHTYCPELHSDIQFGDKSQGGRGGMTAKMEAAWRAAEQGCTTVIANGKMTNSILHVVSGQLEGTMFDVEAAQEMLEGSKGKPPLAQKLSGEDSKQLARKAALAARSASRALQGLPSKKREEILEKIADAIDSRHEEILKENEGDVKTAKETKIDENLMQRLGMKPQKLKNLTAGIRSIAKQSEPIRKVLKRTELADGLVLEKVTSPIGVLLIIFEARPDALPQIAALAIRSGNGLLLKGGKEAARSNAILHKIITQAIEEVAPEVGGGLIDLVTTRQGVDDLLELDDVIDLVIPRGSNALVSHIQHNTRIPVMGHADGICHMYIDTTADIRKACQLAVDSKIDYPAACNALEKLLVHQDLATDGRLFQLMGALRDNDIQIFGGEKAAHHLGLNKAPADKHEYGEKKLTLELVDGLETAVDHIHKYGSSHTECIVTEDEALGEEFLRKVDSACVNVNASTRFSDGFRYGLGAEVGIATGRIHARGPVGVEGLLTTKYLLRGQGQTVEKDANITYTHKDLEVSPGAVSPLETVQANGHK